MDFPQRIIGNLDYVVRNRLKDDIEFVSYYDNRQLPLYRKWACEETKFEDKGDAMMRAKSMTRQLSEAMDAYDSRPTGHD